MEKQKRNIILIFVLALAAACVIFIPARREIDEDFTCYACHQDDPDYRQEVTVTFTGTYVDYLFLADRFEGYIDVSPFDYLAEDFCPDGADPLDLTLKPDNTAHILYRAPVKTEDGRVKTTFCPRGLLRANEDLSAFQLGYFVPNADDSNSRTIEVILSCPDQLGWEDASNALFSD